MSRFTEWIKRHQVLTYFVIAYVITWTGFLLVYWIFPGNMMIEGLMAPIVFSPAIAALLITGIAKSQPRVKFTKSRRMIFLRTWLIASIVGMFFGWKVVKMGFSTPMFVFYCLWALFPAWTVSSVYARKPGIREHFATILKPRGPAIWYIVVFLIFPGVQLLDIAITRLLGGETYSILTERSLADALVFFLADFLMGFLFTGGINEESGWRGFALPRLQARYPVIIAVGIVWFFWALWHVPWDIGRGVPLEAMLRNRLLWNLVFAILLSWVYNRTNGSILAPALLHPAMNTFGNNLGGGEYSQYLFIGLALFAILYDKMWKKLPVDHPAVYAQSESSDLKRVASDLDPLVTSGAYS